MDGIDRFWEPTRRIVVMKRRLAEAESLLERGGRGVATRVERELGWPLSAYLRRNSSGDRGNRRLIVSYTDQDQLDLTLEE